MSSQIKVDNLNNLAGSGYIQTVSGVSLDLRNATSGLRLPVGTTLQRPSGAPAGEVRYNSTLNALEVSNGNNGWIQVALGSDGSSIQAAANSASELKQTLIARDGIATNGRYWYNLPSGTARLWTDFTTYAPYNFVMITVLGYNDHNHYQNGNYNQAVLEAMVPNNAPSASSGKLSDTDINHIFQPGSIRWVIVGPNQSFYRIDDQPQWYSDHGAAASCSYSRGFYNGYAIPSGTPNWRTDYNSSYEACGGLYSPTNWIVLSGIHVNDSNYKGGYSGGASEGTNDPVSPYQSPGYASDFTWNYPGYVLASW